MLAYFLLLAAAVAAPPVSEVPPCRSYFAFVLASPNAARQRAPLYVFQDREPERHTRWAVPLQDLFKGCSAVGVPIIRLTVTRTGHVKAPHIVRGTGCALADARYIQAVSAWRFWPAVRGAREVSRTLTTTIMVGGQ